MSSLFFSWSWVAFDAKHIVGYSHHGVKQEGSWQVPVAKSIEVPAKPLSNREYTVLHFPAIQQTGGLRH
jgi:hypothetical protein